MYRHTQICYPNLVGPLIICLLLDGVLFYYGGKLGAAMLMPLGFLFVAAFSVLTVEIRGDRLRWRFAPGLIGRSVKLSDIREVRFIDFRKSPIFAPIAPGVNWRGMCWVYYASGNQAVQVQLASGRTYLIGSDDAEALYNTLTAAAPLWANTERAARAP